MKISIARAKNGECFAICSIDFHENKLINFMNINKLGITYNIFIFFNSVKRLKVFNMWVWRVFVCFLFGYHFGYIYSISATKLNVF